MRAADFGRVFLRSWRSFCYSFAHEEPNDDDSARPTLQRDPDEWKTALQSPRLPAEARRAHVSRWMGRPHRGTDEMTYDIAQLRGSPIGAPRSRQRGPAPEQRAARPLPELAAIRDPTLQRFTWTWNAIDAPVTNDLERRFDGRYRNARLLLRLGVRDVKVCGVVGARCQYIEAVAAAMSVGDSYGAPALGHYWSLCESEHKTKRSAR